MFPFLDLALVSDARMALSLLLEMDNPPLSDPGIEEFVEAVR